jgi:hypothetical protein
MLSEVLNHGKENFEEVKKKLRKEGFEVKEE